MKHIYYTTSFILALALVTACGSPNRSKAKTPQKRLSESFYGTFGGNTSDLYLTDATPTQRTNAGSSAPSSGSQTDLELELRMEKERQKLLAAKSQTSSPATPSGSSSNSTVVSVADGYRRPAASTSSSASYASSASASSSSSSYNSRPSSSSSSSYASSAGSASSNRPSSVNYQNYQYNSSNNYATSRGRLTALSKADEPKLKKYNVIIASLRMESGKDRLSRSFDKASEQYIVARSGTGFFTFVVGSFEKRGDAIAYRNQIINKYTSRYSENELFNTFGIIFSDAWILEI